MGIIKFNLNVGDKYGKLTLIDKVQRFKSDGSKNGKGWMVQCECGKISGPKVPADIYNGKVKSCGECQRKYYWDNSRNIGDKNTSKNTYRNYRSRARSRNINFNLSYTDFMNIILLPCVYCNNTETSYFNPQNSWEETFRYTGIDRINSSLGYELNNVQPCCKWCNMAKSDRTEKEFLQWVRNVYASL